MAGGAEGAGKGGLGGMGSASSEGRVRVPESTPCPHAACLRLKESDPVSRAAGPRGAEPCKLANSKQTRLSYWACPVPPLRLRNASVSVSIIGFLQEAVTGDFRGCVMYKDNNPAVGILS